MLEVSIIIIVGIETSLLGHYLPQGVGERN